MSLPLFEKHPVEKLDIYDPYHMQLVFNAVSQIEFKKDTDIRWGPPLWNIAHLLDDNEASSDDIDDLFPCYVGNISNE